MGTAICNLGAHLRFWSVAVAGVALDLWSKDWAFRTLRQGGHRTIIPNLLEFHTTLNPGALFGIGAGHTGIFLVASVLALALVLWMFAHSAPQRRLSHVALAAILAGALGNMYDRVFVQLVVQGVSTSSGPAARFYVPQDSPDSRWIVLREYPPDSSAPERRVRRDAGDPLPPAVGYVRDFIKIPTRWLGGRDIWPWVFNVADMLLVAGVGLLALRMLLERRTARAQSADLDAGDAGS